MEVSVNLCIWGVVINSRAQHSFHGALKGGDLLPQRVSFQTSRSSGCKQHWGRSQCLKSNSSRFHHGSASLCQWLVSDSPLLVWAWTHNKLRASLPEISELGCHRTAGSPAQFPQWWCAHRNSRTGFHCLAPWNRQTWHCMMAAVDPRRRHELGSPLHTLTIHYHRPDTRSHGNMAVWWRGA